MGLRIGKNNFNPELKVLPINESTVLYAFQGGSKYHLTTECPMLTNGQYEKYGYGIITLKDIKNRQLKPCRCAVEGGLEYLKKTLGQ